jgi:uncharacterized membrane protein YkvA (DUF1232 family)
MDNSKYVAQYKSDSYWKKLKSNIFKTSSKLIELSLISYYALKDDDTPSWAKSVLAGALGYFIFPIDAIPDFLPVIGYSDDLAVLISAIVAVGFNIKPSHKEKAKDVIRKWYFNIK